MIMKTQSKLIPDVERDFFCAISYRDSLGFNKAGQRTEIPTFQEKTSPCRAACPIGIDIAEAFYQASKGNFDEALRVYRQENPLPGICGRVCYHPCEMSCNRKDFDEAINIRAFERFLSDHGRVDVKEEASTSVRKEKIAVIGSGPAGLSASYHLARLGFVVTIFEAQPEPGGMLMYGIPEYRLPKAILKREIDYIRQLGVAIRTGVRVGRDISLSQIRNEYQALFVAAGAHGGVRLGVEGDKLPGVLEGITFLRNVNLGERKKVGKQVAVIGGGNTAIDCARVARRLGAEEVRIIYRRSLAEMPALTEDVASVEAEGIALELLAAPKRLISQNERVSAIECLRMELGAPDATGRRQPVPVTGSEFIIPIDTVIAAVGQVPETEFVTPLGLSLSEKGMIEITSERGTTAIEGVFAGGDSIGGKAFVADAIASGKMATLAIVCFLEGKDSERAFQAARIGAGSSFAFQRFLHPADDLSDLKQVVPFDRINTLFFRQSGRNSNHNQSTPGENVRSFEEVAMGATHAEMDDEISRCFKCGTCIDCQNCMDFCPDVSILRDVKLGLYGFDEDHCKGCGICSVACPRNIVEMVNQNENVPHR